MTNGLLQREQEPSTSVGSQVQPPAQMQSKKQKRGITWVLGSFILCPCHLPLTLGLFTAIFGGTAMGTFFTHFSILAGVITTLLWLAGTWYGFRQLRTKFPTTCAIR